jgi:hypothetical protein
LNWTGRWFLQWVGIKEKKEKKKKNEADPDPDPYTYTTPKHHLAQFKKSNLETT